MSTEDRQILSGYINEGVSALQRKQQAADELKDIVNVVNEKFPTLEKPVVRDAINTAFKATLQDKKTRLAAVEELVGLAASTVPVFSDPEE